jgi:hypothetical protein
VPGRPPEQRTSPLTAGSLAGIASDPILFSGFKNAVPSALSSECTTLRARTGRGLHYVKIRTAVREPLDEPTVMLSEPAASQRRSIRLTEAHLANLGLLAILPLALVLFNDYWPYTSAYGGFIDPWLYTSYFLHLKAQLLAFPGAYYGDRLSDSLPGWTIYHIFGPWIGNYVFKLTVIWTASFAIYFSTCRLLSKRAALVAGLLVGAQPHFLMAFGWDYVDGIGIAYYGLSMLFAFRAAQSKAYKLSMFASGVFCNCLITSHFLWLNLAWIIPLGFLLANRIGSRHSIWKSLGMFVLGLAFAALVFAGIYHELTGYWLYLGNSIRHTLNGFGAAQKVNAPISQWIDVAFWLVHHNGLVLVAIWLIFRRMTTPPERLCLVLFTTSYVTVWGWQLVGFPFAMLLFYTSFLFPVYALGLAAILNRPLAMLNPRWYKALVISILAGSLILIWLAPFWNRSTNSLLVLNGNAVGAWMLSHQMWAVSGICLCATVLACLTRPKHAWLIGVFTLGMFGVYALQLTLGQKQGWFTNPHTGIASDFTNKQAFRLILDADAWANQYKEDRKIVWWANNTEPRTGIIGGLTSLYLWGWSVLGQDLPRLSRQDMLALDARPTILVPTWTRENLDQARETLAKQDFSIVREHTTSLTNGNLELHLALFEVTPTVDLTTSIISRENLTELPNTLNLEQISATASSVAVHRPADIQIAAEAPRWAYLAEAPLKFPDSGDQFWILVEAKVVKGQIGFGVLNGAETDFYQRRFLNEDNAVEDIILNVTHPADSHKFVIENGDTDGRRTEVIIRKIALYGRSPSREKADKHAAAQ